jgi:hypothetical protein
MKTIDFLNIENTELESYKKDWFGVDCLEDYIFKIRNGYRYNYLLRFVKEFIENFNKDKTTYSFFDEAVREISYNYYCKTGKNLEHISDGVLYIYFMSNEYFREQYNKTYNKQWMNVIPMSDLMDLHLHCKYLKLRDGFCYGIEVIDTYFDELNYKQFHKYYC